MGIKKLISILTVSALLAFSLAGNTLADSDSIYLSPSTRTITDGSSFSLELRADSVAGANTIQANISYPASQLEYVSVSYTNSAMEVQAQSSGGGGSITIARGTLTTFTGDNYIATLVFRALVSSGTAAITFTSGTSLANNGAYNNTTTSGASISFAPAPAPAQAPVVDKTPPVISDVAATDITKDSATITWQTNKPSDSNVNYGTDNQYGLMVNNSALVTSHSVVLSSSFLVPDTTFHFLVLSVDGSGNKQIDTDRTFTTLGIPILVVVNNSAGQPVEGAIVTVGNTTVQTNKDGQAEPSVGLGPQTIVISNKGQTTTQQVNVSKTNISSTKPQLVDIRLTKQSTSTSSYAMWLIPLVFIFGILVGGLIWHRDKSTIFSLFMAGRMPRQLKRMKVSDLEKNFGDVDPNRNPYQKLSKYTATFKKFHRKGKK